jgi:ABC-type multidrug transport system fused ATPase/permease subunit
VSPASWVYAEPDDGTPVTDAGVTEDGRLPVASPAGVRRQVLAMARRHRRLLGVAVALHVAAALAGAVGPQLLGRMVEAVQGGTTTAEINRLVLGLLAALVAQTLLTRWARYRSGALGETVLAELREGFLTRAVGLPLGTVERAGTGDLVTRTTTDVDRLSFSVRSAVPEIVVALVTAAVLAVALVVTSPLLALVPLVSLPLVAVAARWYRRRAPRVYREEMSTYGAVNAGVAETVDAGRTIEAMRLGPQQVRRTDDRIRTWLSWEYRSLRLRLVLFPALELGNVASVAAMLLAGGLLLADGRVGLAQVTAAVLYAQLLAEPVDAIVLWYDDLQIGGASLARLVGVDEIAAPDTHHDEPERYDVLARHVRYAYRAGHDVLHGVDLDVAPGSRVAVVGPSGAGKSTLGRLLAGIHPPRTGSVDMGGVPLAGLPPERLRRHVALVTQEHHVFVGSLRDNLRLARPDASDDEILAALAAVDAGEWADRLGLDAEVGSGGATLSPAQAQQVALARLVLADPHTLILDEATSLIDPRAARHLERSLAAVLQGRTVVAVAHRLQTAHDADVVAVVEDGRVREYGRHEDLLAAGGSYAALWRSWHGDDAARPSVR